MRKVRMLEDLTEIAAEKGIRLYNVRVKRGRLERELKLPNAGVCPAGSKNAPSIARILRKAEDMHHQTLAHRQMVGDLLLRGRTH
jgi:hypothetical protein